MASWRSGTTKQYQTYLAKWQAFCNEHKLDTHVAQELRML